MLFATISSRGRGVVLLPATTSLAKQQLAKDSPNQLSKL
jgi:hypothetical protein